MISERIKEVRKALELTQTVFAQRIGLKQNSIALIESGKRNISDQAILSICREFNVNESWLRSGEGSMFIELTDEEEIAELVGKILYKESDDFRRRLLYVLAKLDDDELVMLEKITHDIVADHKAKEKD